MSMERVVMEYGGERITLEVPAGTSEEEIAQYLQSQNGSAPSSQAAEEPQAEPGFWKRSADRFSDSVAGARQAFHQPRWDSTKDDIGWIQEYSMDPEKTEAVVNEADKFLDAGGHVFGGAWDQIFDTAMTAADALTGGLAGEAVDTAKEAVLESEAGKAVTGKISDLVNEYPGYAERAIDFAQIGLPKVPKLGTLIGDRGRHLINKKTGFYKRLEKNKEDLLAQKAAQAVEDVQPMKPKQGTRMEFDENGRIKYEASPWEREVATEVAAVPGYRPFDNMLVKMNVVEKRSQELYNRLVNRITKAGNPQVNQGSIVAYYNGVLEKLANDGFGYMNAAQKAEVERMVMHAYRLAKESDGTALGILNARQEFDRWLKTANKGVFDPDIATASRTAKLVVRDTLNKVADNATIGVSVKNDLKKISRLMYAKDAMWHKSQKLAEGKLGRLRQALEKRLGTKFPTTIGAQAAAPVMATAWAKAYPEVATAIAGILTATGGKKAYQFFSSPAGKDALNNLSRLLGEYPALKSEKAILGSLLEDLRALEEADEYADPADE